MAKRLMPTPRYDTFKAKLAVVMPDERGSPAARSLRLWLMKQYGLSDAAAQMAVKRIRQGDIIPSGEYVLAVQEWLAIYKAKGGK